MLVQSYDWLTMIVILYVTGSILDGGDKHPLKLLRKKYGVKKQSIHNTFQIILLPCCYIVIS